MGYEIYGAGSFFTYEVCNEINQNYFSQSVNISPLCAIISCVWVGIKL